MKIVSFFAGCGGLDLGFEQAGFQVVWANELEQSVRDTYLRNHPNTKFVLGDICQINPQDIPDCDGFIGGPPCQSWSVGGKQKGLDDARGELFLKYIDLISAKKPKFFVIENVKGLLDNKFKDVFNDFLSHLNGAGYNVKWALLNAVSYRVPQNRERVFIVGFRKDLNVNFSFPNPTCSEPIVLENAIGDIREEPNRISSAKIKVSKSDIKTSCQYPNHDVLTSRFGSFYYRGNRRRGWHQPSFTINATADFMPLHPSSPKMIYYGHEKWNFQKDKFDKYRRMSVRECARIQTFPDNFIFYYENIKDAYKMIGNAVPPRLGKEIAKSISDALSSKDVVHIPFQDTPKDQTDETILIGFYKGNSHKRLIHKYRLYYVRSDGRKGSIFKSDCSVTPKYLLLHNKEEFEIYELDAEEPVLADASFLQSLGYTVSGKTYLCFKLKSAEPKNIQDIIGYTAHPNYNQKNYSPYFTTIGKLTDTRV